MDIAAIRYENFMELLRRYQADRGGKERGMLLDFSQLVGVSSRQLSHLKCKNRPVGTATARRIEAACNLPLGWMDVLHTASEPSTDAERAFLDACLQAYRDDPLRAHEMLLAIIQKGGRA
jgi:transcriptional regulator with XRE-family HTH domain